MHVELIMSSLLASIHVSGDRVLVHGHTRSLKLDSKLFPVEIQSQLRAKVNMGRDQSKDTNVMEI